MSKSSIAVGGGGQVPGVFELTGRVALPRGLLLLAGPPGAGKTMYCRQFLADGLVCGERCICVSSDMSEEQFTSMFPDTALVDDSNNNNLKVIALHSHGRKVRLPEVLSSVRGATKETQGRPVRVAVDSLTYMSALYGEKAVMKFITDLSFLLKEAKAEAIFTLTTYRKQIDSELSLLADGILEMKLDDEHDVLCRSIRLRSIKGLSHEPAWASFRITDEGSIVFDKAMMPARVALSCVMCGKSIEGTPLMDFDLAFDSRMCLETYKKLAGIYGHSISESGLAAAEVLNVSFFFTDIVGLSDPSLSVGKQIQKIQVLNGMTASCDAFRMVPKEKKIILPTGDGMAIGFLLNPELPLELGMQLHRLLRSYNAVRMPEDRINVRIGLGSGPVFIVADINNNQNIWGPGIILARRVMDAGDSGHILIAGKLAEELISLKDEYRRIIKPVCDYQIKHGQTIMLYSAYSRDFGNPEMPSRIAFVH